MPLRPHRVVLVSMWCLLLARLAFGAEAERSWQVPDSIGVRYFSTNPAFMQTWSFGEEVGDLEHPLFVSPDGQHFAFVTHRGELECDCNRYELWVYSVSQVRAALAVGHAGPLAPLYTTEMRSQATEMVIGDTAGIREAFWPDAQRVVFTGSTSATHDGLYQLDVRTGKVERLTDPAHEVLGGRQLHGDSLVYLTYPQISSVDAKKEIRYPVEAIRGSRLGELYSQGESVHFDHIKVVVAQRGKPARVAISYIRPRSSYVRPAVPLLSGDGRWAVVVVPAYEEKQKKEAVSEEEESEPEINLPSGWDQYAGLDRARSSWTREDYQRLWRYELVDMREGVAHAMVDAPKGPQKTAAMAGTPEIFWSADSGHVVLVNVGLPLTEDLEQRREMGYLVDYEVKTGRWTVLEAMAGLGERGVVSRKVQSVGWVREGRELLVKHVTGAGTPATGTLYTLSGSSWRGRSVAATMELPPPAEAKETRLAGGMEVDLRQSANDPPVMVAKQGKREIALTGPDPALQGIWRARQERVQWPEREGHTGQGGLLLPREHSGALPLVIQVEYYQEHDFRPDGSVSTAYAAQALVGQGMAVLRMDAGSIGRDYPQLDIDRWVKGETKEPRFLETVLIRERIDAAVETLASQGRIDPARVGLLGFSRTGFYTYYAITHPGSVKPAAAIVADATTESYAEYIMWQAAAQDPTELISTDTQYGGRFWQQKSTWVEHAPVFNVERCETPTLFTFDAWDPLRIPLLETFSAFQLTDREFDMMVLPEGGHQLQQPRQRQASLQLTVDWMNFWLQGREDADPKKASQYRYWRGLRAHKLAREAVKTRDSTSR